MTDEIRYWRHRFHQMRVDLNFTIEQAAELLLESPDRVFSVEYRDARINLNTIRSWWSQLNAVRESGR